MQSSENSKPQSRSTLHGEVVTRRQVLKTAIRHNWIVQAYAIFALRFTVVLIGLSVGQFCGTELHAQTAAAPTHKPVLPFVSSTRQLDLPPGVRPAVVRPSFQLIAIHKIDDEAETVEFSGVLTLVWTDSRQAFDPALEGVAEKFYHGGYQFNELSPAWYPQVVLGNAAGVNDIEEVLLRVKPDGTSTLIQPVHAVARSRMNLRRYPFDQQRLEVVFGVLGFDIREVILVPDAGAAFADLSKTQVPQWNITGFEASTRSVVATHAAPKGNLSAFVLTIDLRRQPFFMVRLVILPLMLIVVLSWSVFWMDRMSLGDRMSVSFVGILTSVAYQAMVSDIIPQIAYVTFINAFMSFSFLVMCATAAVNLVVGEFDRRGNSQRGDLVDHRCRWIFPLGYGGMIVVDWIAMFFWF
jgi:hypothetical protein